VASLNNIQNSFVGSFRDRIKDPILGTFLCASIFWNWHPLALLFFGDGSSAERIDEFHALFSAKYFFLSENPFAYPLYFTLIYVLIYPVFVILINTIQSYINNKARVPYINSEKTKADQEVELNKKKFSSTDPESLKRLIDLDIEDSMVEEKAIMAKRDKSITKREGDLKFFLKVLSNKVGLEVIKEVETESGLRYH